MGTVADLFSQAVRHHQNGNLAQAEALYRRVIQADPAHADALHFLGIIAVQSGHPQSAIPLIRQAIALKPGVTDFPFNLGVLFKNLEQWDEAINCFQQVLDIQPNHAEAANNLGLAFIKQRRLDEAAALTRRALDNHPGNANLHNNLGIVLAKMGQLGEAIECYKRALNFNPNLMEAHDNLGVALKIQGNLEEAITCFKQAVQLQPNHADTHCHLGNAFHAQDKIAEAEECYRHVLRLDPKHADAHNYLGNVLKDMGRLDEAIACYQNARKYDPQNHRRYGNLLYCKLFHTDFDSAALLKEHRIWEREYAQPLETFQPFFANDSSPERRLRIGYVSSFFCDQVVGRNVWPLIREHNHEHFEITLYANLVRPDTFSDRFRQAADRWRNIANWSDERVVDIIRQDAIDVLVDLDLHLGGNRLLIFARKPAPIQVTFAGYPGTTGLSVMDYRLTDPYLDPPGFFDDFYAEKSFRLPHSFWCYDPLSEDPEVGPLPALANGFVTFGCLNNFCKINDKVLDLWAQVMHAVPRSRLLLLTQEGSQRRRTLDFMSQRGIQNNRIEFSARLSTPDYLALYQRIDLGLDTFPYNGHTTSLDSFWMGVPVITQVGYTVVGRGGLSQLTNLGLRGLVADAPEDFVRLATSLAGDLPRLKNCRTGLRSRMKASALMDAAGFARGIENAFRTMWRESCRSPHGSSNRG